MRICTNYDCDQAVYTALDGLTTMGLSHYTFPEAGEPADAVNGTVRILEYFARTLGEYPFLTEKYANATWPWGGGSANQTVANINSRGAGSDGLNSLNVHETSHQYFACLISISQIDHVWLVEGFAAYCEALFIEDREGLSPVSQQDENLFLEHFGRLSTSESQSRRQL